MEVPRDPRRRLGDGDELSIVRRASGIRQDDRQGLRWWQDRSGCGGVHFCPRAINRLEGAVKNKVKYFIDIERKIKGS